MTRKLPFAIEGLEPSTLNQEFITLVTHLFWKHNKSFLQNKDKQLKDLLRNIEKEKSDSKSKIYNEKKNRKDKYGADCSREKEAFTEENKDLVTKHDRNVASFERKKKLSLYIFASLAGIFFILPITLFIATGDPTLLIVLVIPAALGGVLAFTLKNSEKRRLALIESHKTNLTELEQRHEQKLINMKDEYLNNLSGELKEIQETAITNINNLEEEKTKVFRRHKDVKLMKIIKSFWQFKIYPFSAKQKLIIDISNITPPVHINFPVLSTGEQDKLQKCYKVINLLSEKKPPLLYGKDEQTNLYGIEKMKVKANQKITSLLKDIYFEKGIISFIPPGDELLQFTNRRRDKLMNCTSGQTLNDSSRQNLKTIDSEIKKFIAFKLLKDKEKNNTLDVEKYLMDIVADIQKNKEFDQKNVPENINKRLTEFVKPIIANVRGIMQNVYCPKCNKIDPDLLKLATKKYSDMNKDERKKYNANKDEIKDVFNKRNNARMEITGVSKGELIWQCVLCASRITTNQGTTLLKLDKLKDSIYFPIWEHLWFDLDTEKQRIDRHANDRIQEQKSKIFQLFSDAQSAYRDNLREFNIKVRDLKMEFKTETNKAKRFISELMARSYISENEHQSTLASLNTEEEELNKKKIAIDNNLSTIKEDDDMETNHFSNEIDSICILQDPVDNTLLRNIQELKTIKVNETNVGEPK